MNVEEARSVLLRHLSSYRAKSYADLVAMVGETESIEVAGSSGQSYQIEVNVVWDDKPGGDVRALGAIDDGSPPWAFTPLVESFIMAPDGTFVDED